MEWTTDLFLKRLGLGIFILVASYNNQYWMLGASRFNLIWYKSVPRDQSSTTRETWVQIYNAWLSGVPKLNRAELEAACEDFSNIINSYSVCTVYKGTLSSGVEIAVVATAVPPKDWSKRSEECFIQKVYLCIVLANQFYLPSRLQPASMVYWAYKYFLSSLACIGGHTITNKS